VIALLIWITVQAGTCCLHSVPANFVRRTSPFEKGEGPDRIGFCRSRMSKYGQLRSFAPDAQFNANRTFDEPPASVVASPLCLELFIG
jgi:hypothetical protein